ncbi:hypothetical protein JHK85_032445 [Glycine max]|nr:hypothetical protein JHK85_032445 [Glycine max]
MKEERILERRPVFRLAQVEKETLHASRLEGLTGVWVGKSLNPIDMTLIDGFSIKADTATIIEK